MKSKKLLNYPEELDINIGLLASELDTDPNRLRYFDNKDTDLDVHDVDSFNRLFKDIKENATLITSLNDSTELFEYGDDNIIVVLYAVFEHYLIIVDTEDVKTIRAIMKTLDE